MSGEQKHTPEEKTAFIQGWVAKHRHLSDENAALKTSLAELTDFTESLVAMHAHAYAFADAEFEKMAAESKAIIDRAKKLLSDKTE